MTIDTGILTVSDRSFRGQREDQSGPVLVRAITDLGWQARLTAVVPDEIDQIRDMLLAWCTSGLQLILTTGGTGFAPRDVTPEATRAVIEREAPGLCEAMRSASLIITPHAMLSRATAGIKGKTLIVNLPGSPRAAIENLRVIAPVLPHAVELIQETPGAEQGHHLKTGKETQGC